MAGAILRAQRPKGPAQRIRLVLLPWNAHIHLGEAWPLGQQGTAVDAVGQGGVSPLQKGQNTRHQHRNSVRLLQMKAQRLAGGGQGGGCLAQGAQALRAEELQHEQQGEIGLARIHIARAQKAGQVSGARVRGVELRHRRDERQHTGHGQGLRRG